VSIILTFFLWLIAKNVTKEEVRYFLVGFTILITVIILVMLIMSISTWNFKNVSKTIHEIGQTYFENFTIMLTKVTENSNNKNPIIIHNTGTSTQTSSLVPDQKSTIALSPQNKKPELEYITLKELTTGESQELNPKFFENNLE